ncbi:hypothetical protein B0H17DRAFT_1203582 [Mycena rosella]|uniref:Infection structure specific protein n=1 Tax=Mycena rosella TaxID=1033263 RepID=A0AAD7DB82_MYCRO|nr:hypothetical protein B0H17DRAFT_1203582 [Mycena rosella]
MRSAQSILTVFSLLASSSVVHGRYPARTLLGRRDDAAQTVTFGIDPSPTLTDAAISSAYSLYSQKCGSDLNDLAYSAFSLFVAAGGAADTPITADVCEEFLEQDVGSWGLASISCDDASNTLDLAIAADESTSTTGAPSPTTTQLTTTRATETVPTGSLTSSFTGIPALTSGGPVSTSQRTGGSQSTQTPDPSDKNGATADHPAGILSVIAAVLLQAVWWT